MMTTLWARVVAACLIVLSNFGAGWAVNGWRLSGQIAHIKQVEAEGATQRTNAALAAQTRIFAAQQDQAQKLADIDKDELYKLKGVKDENDRLRKCIGNGTCGLRIAAHCDGGGVSASATGTGVSTGGACRLDPSARSDYLALREGLTRQYSMLLTCQAALRTYSDSK